MLRKVSRWSETSICAFSAILISNKEIFVAHDYHLHHLSGLEELDVGSAANPRIHC
jgi:hypothetical protein